MNIDYYSKSVRDTASDADLIGTIVFPMLATFCTYSILLLTMYLSLSSNEPFDRRVPGFIAISVSIALEIYSVMQLIRTVRFAALYTTVFAGVMQFLSCSLAIGYVTACCAYEIVSRHP